MDHIRKATTADVSRIAEILVFTKKERQLEPGTTEYIVKMERRHP